VLAPQPGSRFVTVWVDTARDGDQNGIFGHQLGKDVLFKDGFESGTLARWSSAATDGGNLSPSVFAALNTTSVGLGGLVNGTASLFVQDDTPIDEDFYLARFYFDTNGYDPGETGGARRTRLFIMFEEAPTRRLAAIVLKRVSGAYSIEARCRLDDDS